MHLIKFMLYFSLPFLNEVHFDVRFLSFLLYYAFCCGLLMSYIIYKKKFAIQKLQFNSLKLSFKWSMFGLSKSFPHHCSLRSVSQYTVDVINIYNQTIIQQLYQLTVCCNSICLHRAVYWREESDARQGVRAYETFWGGGEEQEEVSWENIQGWSGVRGRGRWESERDRERRRRGTDRQWQTEKRQEREKRKKETVSIWFLWETRK